MNASQDIRIIPVVLAALAGLVVLKISTLVMDERHAFVLGPIPWAQRASVDDMRGSLKHMQPPDSRHMGDVTGSVGAKQNRQADIDAGKTLPATDESPSDKQNVKADNPSPERAVLESLQERRRQLDARAREIDIQKNLLTAAEHNLKLRIESVEAREKRLAELQEKKSEEDLSRVKTLVAIYEGMKPKDAAKILSRMEVPVLVDVTSHMSPRKMSEILGLMQVDVAERLTVELARRAGLEKALMLSDLPKIEGVRTDLRP